MKPALQLLRELRGGPPPLLRPASTLPPSPSPRIDYGAIYADLATEGGTADDLAAISRHVDFNGFWVAQEVTWLDRRCDRLARERADEATYRAAVVLLVARIDELRRRHLGVGVPSTPRRLHILVNHPVSGPVTLPDGTEIGNVGRFLGRLLTAVDYVLGHPEVTAAKAVLDVFVAQLATLGVVGELETVR